MKTKPGRPLRILGLLSPFLVVPGPTGTAAGLQEPLPPEAAAGVPQAEAPAHREVWIPMRDGRRLAATLRLPSADPGAGPWPVVLVQTPYGREGLGRVASTEAGEAARGSARALEILDQEETAWLFVDWRGFHGSREAALPARERLGWSRGRDGYDCVEWAARQPWCNGRVATWGGSALGKQQFDTAAEQPPHLVAAVPLIAYQGMRYASFYEGGVLLDYHVRTLDLLGFGVGARVRSNRDPDAAIWQWLQRRTWHPEKIQVPCLLVSGWWDHFPGEVIEQWQTLREEGQGRARESRLILGPWTHTRVDLAEQGVLRFPGAADFSSLQTRAFLERELLGRAAPEEAQPAPITVFQAGASGRGAWVSGASWESLTGPLTAWSLLPDGRLHPGASFPEGGPGRAFAYDPRRPAPTLGGRNLPPLDAGPAWLDPLLERQDVLLWEGPVLEQPLAVRGTPELHICIQADAPDVDLNVRLADRLPDGRLVLIREGIQRASLQPGPERRLLRPEETRELRVRLAPLAWTWEAGHRLALVLTGGSFPRYEPNPQNGDPSWSAEGARRARIHLPLRPEAPAILYLPRVPVPEPVETGAPNPR